jgi:hypothetical protein
LAEAYRVVKPGGPVFVAFITRYAAHRYAAAHDQMMGLKDPEESRMILETGKLPPREIDGFIAYLAHPDEVTPLCSGVGFDVENVFGVEGLVSMLEDNINPLEGEAWDYWVNLNHQIAPDPSIHGAVEHLLALCRKPRWKAVLKTIVRQLDAVGIAYRVVGGTALALRDLPVPVNDIDLEMTQADAYRFGELFPDAVVDPVSWRESDNVRSHFGRFQIDGFNIEVMSDLEWLRDGRWVPTFSRTRDTVPLEGIPVSVLELEEETLAYLRRGKLDRAALALPHCDPDRFQVLLKDAIAQGMF